MKYIVAGNVMVDSVSFSDGKKNRDQLGGPVVFAYSGVRLFTEDAMLVCNVGQDFDKYFTEWVRRNNVHMQGVKVKADYCNHSYLMYHSDGTYVSERKAEEEDWVFVENLGYLKTSPTEIEAHTKAGGVEGVYMAQNCDRYFWETLGAVKQRDGFKMMWEIEGPFCKPKYYTDILFALQFTDIFSINIQECTRLSGLSGEEANIEFLKKLPVDMVLFRVGKKGLYTIQNGRHYFHATVTADIEIDPTGCGNTSTGAALYAYCQTPNDPVMVGITANVAAAENVRQYGVVPDFAVAKRRVEDKVKELYFAYAPDK